MGTSGTCDKGASDWTHSFNISFTFPPTGSWAECPHITLLKSFTGWVVHSGSQQSPTSHHPRAAVVDTAEVTSTFYCSPSLVTPALGSEFSLLLGNSYQSSHTSLTHKGWLDSVCCTHLSFSLRQNPQCVKSCICSKFTVKPFLATNSSECHFLLITGPRCWTLSTEYLPQVHFKILLPQ